MTWTIAERERAQRWWIFWTLARKLVRRILTASQVAAVSYGTALGVERLELRLDLGLPPLTLVLAGGKARAP